MIFMPYIRLKFQGLKWLPLKKALVMRSVQTGRASNVSWSQLRYITAEMCQNKNGFKIMSGQLQTQQKVNKFIKGKVNQLLKKIPKKLCICKWVTWSEPGKISTLQKVFCNLTS